MVAGCNPGSAGKIWMGKIEEVVLQSLNKRLGVAQWLNTFHCGCTHWAAPWWENEKAVANQHAHSVTAARMDKNSKEWKNQEEKRDVVQTWTHLQWLLSLGWMKALLHSLSHTPFFVHFKHLGKSKSWQLFFPDSLASVQATHVQARVKYIETQLIWQGKNLTIFAQGCDCHYKIPIVHVLLFYGGLFEKLSCGL